MSEQDEDLRTDEEFETLARAEGWTDEDEYQRKGGRGTWVDARTFVLRGETVRPMLRAKVRRLEDEVSRLNGELTTAHRTAQEQRTAIEAATNLARRADERGYKRAIAELEAKRNTAIDEGDRTAALQTQGEIDAMREERAAPVAVSPPPPPPPNQPAPPHLAVAAFIAENPWFETDPALKEAMIAHHRVILVESPMMSLPDQLATAKARVAKAFPAKFTGNGRAPPADDLDDEGPDGELEEEIPVNDRQPPRREAPRAPASNTGARRQAPPRDPATADPFMEITDLADRAEARKAFANLEAQGGGLSKREYVDLFINPKAPVNVIRKRPAA